MRVLAVLGPTASGKSAAAVNLAKRWGATVVSVDSMQVYRGMNIGTAKPTPGTRAEVPHRMVDVADPEEAFSVARFQREARHAVGEDLDAGRPVIISGGSGLHHRAIVDPLEFPRTDAAMRADLESVPREQLVAELLGADPPAGEHVDLANPRRVVRAVEVLRLTGQTPSSRASTERARMVREYRPELAHVAVGFDPGETLPERVVARFDQMLAEGLVAEVASLVDRLGPTAAQAVGYKELLPHVAGITDLTEARRDAIRATQALAKRQRTFFRRDPRIRWLPWDDDAHVRAVRIVDAVGELSWTS